MSQLVAPLRNSPPLGATTRLAPSDSLIAPRTRISSNHPTKIIRLGEVQISTSSDLDKNQAAEFESWRPPERLEPFRLSRRNERRWKEKRSRRTQLSSESKNTHAYLPGLCLKSSLVLFPWLELSIFITGLRRSEILTSFSFEHAFEFSCKSQCSDLSQRIIERRRKDERHRRLRLEGLSQHHRGRTHNMTQAKPAPRTPRIADPDEDSSSFSVLLLPCFRRRSAPS